MQANDYDRVEVVREMLAAGAGKHLVAQNGETAVSRTGASMIAPPGSRAATHALLAAAP